MGPLGFRCGFLVPWSHLKRRGLRFARGKGIKPTNQSNLREPERTEIALGAKENPLPVRDTGVRPACRAPRQDVAGRHRSAQRMAPSPPLPGRPALPESRPEGPRPDGRIAYAPATGTHVDTHSRDTKYRRDHQFRVSFREEKGPVGQGRHRPCGTRHCRRMSVRASSAPPKGAPARIPGLSRAPRRHPVRPECAGAPPCLPC